MDCRQAAYSNDYADAIIDFPVEGIRGDFTDTCVIPVDDRFSVVFRNRALTPEIPGNTYEYQYVPKIYGLMMDGVVGAAQQPFDPSALIESGILSLQGAPLYLRGQNVLVAIIDTGVNFALPQFRDSLGQSRILAMWDQNDGGTKPAPEGYYYGSEYTREDINAALATAQPYNTLPSRDESFHGTIMAGLAAGSEVEETGYIGAAPDADLLVVKLKPCKEYLRNYYRIPPGITAFQETDIMLALKYVNSFAVAFSRPLVVCLGMGTNLGDHSGNNSLAIYMNKLAQEKSRALITCAGNEGNRAHHFRGSLGSDREEGGFVDVEIRVAEGNRGFYMELWGNRTDVLNVSIRSPGGEAVPPMRISEEETMEYSFVFERTTLIVQNVFVEPLSGEQLVRFFFTEPTEGVWTFRVFSASETYNGVFDMWLPIQDFLYSSVEFLEPEPDITITEPDFQESIIVAGAYRLSNGSIWPDSGRGFGRMGEISPTVTAPGVDVPTIYGLRTGSSLAAAITAGGATQLMQWAVVEGKNLLMDGKQLKNYLIKGAIRTPEITYPSVLWGYGRVNIRSVLETLQSR
ncbi:MAG: S8 family peptidase [Lachnospiraceae bacterium]|nr:S8 family peptidase [Lachnospiraceae bacterium]